MVLEAEAGTDTIPKGERIGKCGDSKKGEGKPKCLSKSRAASLRAKGGKKAIAPQLGKNVEKILTKIDVVRLRTLAIPKKEKEVGVANAQILVFQAVPSGGDTYTYNNITFTYDGEKWTAKAPVSTTGTYGNANVASYVSSQGIISLTDISVTTAEPKWKRQFSIFKCQWCIHIYTQMLQVVVTMETVMLLLF